eukprot:6422726-Amphidinium_carterae.1
MDRRLILVAETGIAMQPDDCNYSSTQSATYVELALFRCLNDTSTCVTSRVSKVSKQPPPPPWPLQTQCRGARLKHSL